MRSANPKVFRMTNDTHMNMSELVRDAIRSFLRESRRGEVLQRTNKDCAKNPAKKYSDRELGEQWVTCLNCGHRWIYRGEGEYCRCSICGSQRSARNRAVRGRLWGPDLLPAPSLGSD